MRPVDLTITHSFNGEVIRDTQHRVTTERGIHRLISGMHPNNNGWGASGSMSREDAGVIGLRVFGDWAGREVVQVWSDKRGEWPIELTVF